MTSQSFRRQQVSLVKESPDVSVSNSVAEPFPIPRKPSSSTPFAVPRGQVQVFSFLIARLAVKCPNCRKRWKISIVCQGQRNYPSYPLWRPHWKFFEGGLTCRALRFCRSEGSPISLGSIISRHGWLKHDFLPLSQLSNIIIDIDHALVLIDNGEFVIAAPCGNYELRPTSLV